MRKCDQNFGLWMALKTATLGFILSLTTVHCRSDNDQLLFQCWIEVQAWPLIIEHWHCQACDYSSVRVAKKTSLMRCHFPFKALSIWRCTVETTLSLLPYSDKDFSESRNQGIWDTAIRSHNHFTPDKSKLWPIYGKLVLFSCCQTENSCKSCSSEWKLKIYKYSENIAQSCNARTKSSTHLMFNWNGIREL